MREQIIGLITPTMAVVFMLVFLVMWNRGKMGNYVLAFAASYLFFALGFAATHLLDTSTLYIFHVTQFFYTLSVVSGLWGLAMRVGQPPYLGVHLTIYGLSATTLAVAVLLSTDIAPRLIIVNTGYGAMYLIGTMTLLGAHQREAIDKLIIAVQALLAAQFLIRPVLTLLVESSIAADAYRESLYYSVVNLSLSLISLVAAMVLVGACVYDQIKAVRERAEMDMLTGLRTRRAFEQDVVAQIEKAKLEGVPVSLVVADIDHFKSVNDVWGHQVGDKAIAAFGRVIEDTIRDTDIAGRIGGEEFCVLAWNCEGDAAVAMAERIRKKFGAAKVEGMPEDHRLTASFGVAGRKEGEGYGKLFARTDSALYRAKQEGRNRTLCDGDKRREKASVTPLPTVSTQKRA
ncbi:GGDEF domain-containing protein [Qipengyuania gelatinilytica]|uniref:diguanylate cyclase n=1 Tax=Qipengyuania gelatinilytica TaxID=2867231 RepID=A0ABX9A687_9SPHN|nr:GGDEF domain-containing protein [Qipengyuania gelatinilytica]QZD95839.1 GGDEF domain-containing protein [Qipengyuania gelatinilytica]